MKKSPALLMCLCLCLNVACTEDEPAPITGTYKVEEGALLAVPVGQNANCQGGLESHKFEATTLLSSINEQGCYIITKIMGTGKETVGLNGIITENNVDRSFSERIEIEAIDQAPAFSIKERCVNYDGAFDANTPIIAEDANVTPATTMMLAPGNDQPMNFKIEDDALVPAYEIELEAGATGTLSLVPVWESDSSGVTLTPKGRLAFRTSEDASGAFLLKHHGKLIERIQVAAPDKIKAVLSGPTTIALDDKTITYDIIPYETQSKQGLCTQYSNVLAITDVEVSSPAVCEIYTTTYRHDDYPGPNNSWTGDQQLSIVINPLSAGDCTFELYWMKDQKKHIMGNYSVEITP